MTQVAAQYAAALLAAGGREEDLRESVQLIAAHLSLQQALCDPTVSAAQKQAVLRRLFGASDVLARFYAVLAARGRLDLLPEIAACAHRLALQARGCKLCIMTCARQPQDDLLSAVKDVLCRRHHAQGIELTVCIDPAVLGGFTLEIDGVTYDKSVRGQLHRLSAQLERGP